MLPITIEIKAVYAKIRTHHLLLILQDEPQDGWLRFLISLKVLSYFYLVSVKVLELSCFSTRF